VEDDLRCPRCAIALTSAAAPDLCLAFCERCHGTWLDNVSSQRLVGPDELSQPAQDMIREIDAAWAQQKVEAGYRVAGTPAGDAAALPCPVCRGPLRQVVTRDEQHGVVAWLEICDRDGTWFDRGEAWTLFQGAALERLAVHVRAQQNHADREFYRTRR
jgi:Zn-finger nucleic acid-binding protein